MALSKIVKDSLNILPESIIDENKSLAFCIKQLFTSSDELGVYGSVLNMFTSLIEGVDFSKFLNKIAAVLKFKHETHSSTNFNLFDAIKSALVLVLSLIKTPLDIVRQFTVDAEPWFKCLNSLASVAKNSSILLDNMIRFFKWVGDKFLSIFTDTRTYTKDMAEYVNILYFIQQVFSWGGILIIQKLQPIATYTYLAKLTLIDIKIEALARAGTRKDMDFILSENISKMLREQHIQDLFSEAEIYSKRLPVRQEPTMTYFFSKPAIGKTTLIKQVVNDTGKKDGNTSAFTTSTLDYLNPSKEFQDCYRPMSHVHVITDDCMPCKKDEEGLLKSMDYITGAISSGTFMVEDVTGESAKRSKPILYKYHWILSNDAVPTVLEMFPDEEKLRRRFHFIVEVQTRYEVYRANDIKDRVPNNYYDEKAKKYIWKAGYNDMDSRLYRLGVPNTDAKSIIPKPPGTGHYLIDKEKERLYFEKCKLPMSLKNQGYVDYDTLINLIHDHAEEQRVFAEEKRKEQQEQNSLIFDEQLRDLLKDKFSVYSKYLKEEPNATDVMLLQDLLIKCRTHGHKAIDTARLPVSFAHDQGQINKFIALKKGFSEPKNYYDHSSPEVFLHSAIYNQDIEDLRDTDDDFLKEVYKTYKDTRQDVLEEVKDHFSRLEFFQSIKKIGLFLINKFNVFIKSMTNPVTIAEVVIASTLTSIAAVTIVKWINKNIDGKTPGRAIVTKGIYDFEHYENTHLKVNILAEHADEIRACLDPSVTKEEFMKIAEKLMLVHGVHYHFTNEIEKPKLDKVKQIEGKTNMHLLDLHFEYTLDGQPYTQSAKGIAISKTIVLTNWHAINEWMLIPTCTKHIHVISDLGSQRLLVADVGKQPNLIKGDIGFIRFKEISGILVKPENIIRKEEAIEVFKHLKDIDRQWNDSGKLKTAKCSYYNGNVKSSVQPMRDEFTYKGELSLPGQSGAVLTTIYNKKEYIIGINNGVLVGTYGYGTMLTYEVILDYHRYAVTRQKEGLVNPTFNNEPITNIEEAMQAVPENGSIDLISGYDPKDQDSITPKGTEKGNIHYHEQVLGTNYYFTADRDAWKKDIEIKDKDVSTIFEDKQRAQEVTQAIKSNFTKRMDSLKRMVFKPYDKKYGSKESFYRNANNLKDWERGNGQKDNIMEILFENESLMAQLATELEKDEFNKLDDMIRTDIARDDAEEFRAQANTAKHMGNIFSRKVLTPTEVTEALQDLDDQAKIVKEAQVELERRRKIADQLIQNEHRAVQDWAARSNSIYHGASIDMSALEDQVQMEEVHFSTSGARRHMGEPTPLSVPDPNMETAQSISEHADTLIIATDPITTHVEDVTHQQMQPAAPLPTDNTMFLQRPVKIATLPIKDKMIGGNTTMQCNTVIMDVFANFLKNPMAAAHFRGARFYRFKICLTGILNATPFHYGMLRIFHIPTYDAWKIRYLNNHLTSGYKHVDIKITGNSNFEFEIPFDWHYPTLDFLKYYSYHTDPIVQTPITISNNQYYYDVKQYNPFLFGISLLTPLSVPGLVTTDVASSLALWVNLSDVEMVGRCPIQIKSPLPTDRIMQAEVNSIYTDMKSSGNFLLDHAFIVAPLKKKQETTQQVFKTTAKHMGKPQKVTNVEAKKQATSGFIGTTAKTISDIAELGSKSIIPGLPEIANTVNFGARVVGTIADIFGLARPADVSAPTRIIPRAPELAHATGAAGPNMNLNAEAHSFRMDDIMNFTEEQFSVSNISAMPMDLTLISFDHTSGYGKDKFGWAVNPINMLIKGTDTLEGTILSNAGAGTHGTTIWTHASYLSTVASVARYWRGTIILEYTIIASPQHAGHLRFTHIPATSMGDHVKSKDAVSYMAMSGDAYRDQCHNLIIDISNVEQLNGTFVCPFEIDKPYLSVNEAEVHNISGFVELSVETNITHYTDPTAKVYVLIKVKAGQDFQLGYPSTQNLTNGCGSAMLVAIAAPPDTLIDTTPGNAMKAAGAHTGIMTSMSKRTGCYYANMGIPNTGAPPAKDVQKVNLMLINNTSPGQYLGSLTYNSEVKNTVATNVTQTASVPLKTANLPIDFSAQTMPNMNVNLQQAAGKTLAQSSNSFGAAVNVTMEAASVSFPAEFSVNLKSIAGVDFKDDTTINPTHPEHGACIPTQVINQVITESYLCGTGKYGTGDMNPLSLLKDTKGNWAVPIISNDKQEMTIPGSLDVNLKEIAGDKLPSVYIEGLLPGEKYPMLQTVIYDPITTNLVSGPLGSHPSPLTPIRTSNLNARDWNTNIGKDPVLVDTGLTIPVIPPPPPIVIPKQFDVIVKNTDSEAVPVKQLNTPTITFPNSLDVNVDNWPLSYPVTGSVTVDNDISNPIPVDVETIGQINMVNRKTLPIDITTIMDKTLTDTDVSLPIGMKNFDFYGTTYGFGKLIQDINDTDFSLKTTQTMPSELDVNLKQIAGKTLTEDIISTITREDGKQLQTLNSSVIGIGNTYIDKLISAIQDKDGNIVRSFNSSLKAIGDTDIDKYTYSYGGNQLAFGTYQVNNSAVTFPTSMDVNISKFGIYDATAICHEPVPGAIAFNTYGGFDETHGQITKLGDKPIDHFTHYGSDTGPNGAYNTFAMLHATPCFAHKNDLSAYDRTKQGWQLKTYDRFYGKAEEDPQTETENTGNTEKHMGTPTPIGAYSEINPGVHFPEHIDSLRALIARFDHTCTGYGCINMNTNWLFGPVTSQGAGNERAPTQWQENINGLSKDQQLLLTRTTGFTEHLSQMFSQYRGGLKVMIMNHSDSPIVLSQALIGYEQESVLTNPNTPRTIPGIISSEGTMRKPHNMATGTIVENNQNRQTEVTLNYATPRIHLPVYLDDCHNDFDWDRDDSSSGLNNLIVEPLTVQHISDALASQYKIGAYTIFYGADDDFQFGRMVPPLGHTRNVISQTAQENLMIKQGRAFYIANTNTNLEYIMTDHHVAFNSPMKL